MVILSLARIDAGLVLIGALVAGCNRSERSTSNAVGLSSANDAARASQSSQQRPPSAASAPLPASDAIAPDPFSPADPGGSTITQVIAQARQGGRTEVEYVVPLSNELASYQAYVRHLLTPTPNGPDRPPIPRGFHQERLEPSYLGLLEDFRARRGAAALVVRLGTARAWAVEIPHSFFDEGTLPLGLDLFQAAEARLLIVNTVHRNRSALARGRNALDLADDADPRLASDPAHAKDSFFFAAHAAFVEAYRDGVTVQLHGFRDSSAVGYDVVLSAARTSAELASLARRLREQLGARVALFPNDIGKLGGTSNAEAALSRQHRGRFVHIELSQTFRKTLLADRSRAQRFSAVVAEEVR